ncbi:PREDICTED: uncharacterized protein LOC109480030 [Branchiostoma belcheri]|uniref:Uncharacterized protein LOC109480030 n=1 Tax=Branchiostoma belcheri TaxID=7741 RepID=A0A6P4ZLR6_BRABE|nr:PREDICTED: uncharacterized protein LOC109480030 [Branchiostoma belcheri]
MSYASSNKANAKVPTKTQTFPDNDPPSPGVGRIESPSLSPTSQTSDRGGTRPVKSLLEPITRGTNHTANSNNSSGGNYGVENKDVMKWLERQSDRLILEDNEEPSDDGSGLTEPAIDKVTDAGDGNFGYPDARDRIDETRKETKMQSFLKLPQDGNDLLDDAESAFLKMSITKRSNSSSGSTVINENDRESLLAGSVTSSKHERAFTPTLSNGTRNASIQKHQLDPLDIDAPASDILQMQDVKLSTKPEDHGVNKSLTMRHRNNTGDMETPSALGDGPTNGSLITFINSTAINTSVNAKETVSHSKQTVSRKPVAVASSSNYGTTVRDDRVKKAVEYELAMPHDRERNMMKTRDSLARGDGPPVMSSASRGRSPSTRQPREHDSASTFNGTVNKPIRSRHARLNRLTGKTYKKGIMYQKKYESTGRGSKYKRPNSDNVDVKKEQLNNLMAPDSKDDFRSSDLAKSSLATEDTYSTVDLKTRSHDVGNGTQHFPTATPLAARNDSMGKSGSKLTHVIKGSSYNDVFGKLHVPSVPRAKGQLSMEETPCDAGICQQDGVCIQKETGFFCKCPVLYYGRFCELSKIDMSGLNATKTSITVKWGVRNVSSRANYTVKVSDEALLRAVHVGDDVDMYTFDGLKPGRMYNTCVSVHVHNSTQKIKDGEPPAGTFCINVQTEKENDLFYRPLYAIHIFAVTATVFLAIMVFVTLLTIFQTRRYSLLIDQVLYDDTIVI